MKSKSLVLCGVVLAVAVVAGTSITAERSGGPVPTFNKDVAPIVFNKCVVCHQSGQVAPMSLMSYKETRPWARAMKEKVSKRQMPPWFADPRFNTFRNDFSLTQEQISTIVAWADGGAPEGDTPLSEKVSSLATGWRHPSGRPPDMVIEQAIEYQVPSEGEIPNFSVYQPLPPELQKEDKFVEAVQLLPTVIAATHHSSFGIRNLPEWTKIGKAEAWPGGPTVEGVPVDIKTGKRLASLQGDVNEATTEEGRSEVERRRAAAQRDVFAVDGTSHFVFYVTGGGFEVYPKGMGKRIRHDQYIVWGMHYTPIGKPVSVRQRVGLWFAKPGETDHEIISGRAGDTHIVLGKELVLDETNRFGGTGRAFPRIPVIPPYADNWSITGITAFKDDVTLTLAWPHMHQRGREMTYVVTYPDGREQVVLSVPKYDFAWQLFYEFSEPLKVPAGSTIKSIGSYDNSVNNKWNPAPQKEVYWSEQNWDEMFIGFVDYAIDKLDLRLDKRLAKPQTAEGR